jgi:hypothetical protein
MKGNSQQAEKMTDKQASKQASKHANKQTQASKQSTYSSPDTVVFIVSTVSQYTSVSMFMTEWDP